MNMSTKRHADVLMEAFKKREILTPYNAPVPNFSQRLCDLERQGHLFGRCKVDGKKYFQYWLISEAKKVA